MGQELFENYPKYLLVNGKQVALTNFSKRFDTLEDLYFFYSLQIGHSLKKHDQVIEILNWAKKHNKIHYGIVEFIVGHKWEELEQLKNADIKPIEIADTYDVYESI